MQATLSSLLAFMPHIFKSAHLINRALFNTWLDDIVNESKSIKVFYILVDNSF